MHRWGVFSTETIRVRETVCLYAGVRMNKLQFMMNRSDYVLQIGEWYLDGERVNSTCGKYINDSRGVKGARSNCYYSDKLFYHHGLRLWCVKVICKRHIKPNAECFASYGKQYWEGNTLNRKNIIMVNNFIKY